MSEPGFESSDIVTLVLSTEAQNFLALAIFSAGVTETLVGGIPKE
jgi:hypothetical protein